MKMPATLGLCLDSKPAFQVKQPVAISVVD